MVQRGAEDEYFGPESYLGADGVGGIGGTTDTRICREFSTQGAAIGITQHGTNSLY